MAEVATDYAVESLLGSLLTKSWEILKGKAHADRRTEALKSKILSLSASMESLKEGAIRAQNRGEAAVYMLPLKMIEDVFAKVDALIEEWTVLPAMRQRTSGATYNSRFKDLERQLQDCMNVLYFAMGTATRADTSMQRHRVETHEKQQAETPDKKLYDYVGADGRVDEKTSLLGRGAFGRTHRVRTWIELVERWTCVPGP